MPRTPLPRSLRRSRFARSARPHRDPSFVNTFSANRLDTLVVHGMRLHPTTVRPITELEQWYGLEFRVHAPPVDEVWSP